MAAAFGKHDSCTANYGAQAHHHFQSHGCAHHLMTIRGRWGRPNQEYLTVTQQIVIVILSVSASHCLCSVFGQDRGGDLAAMESSARFVAVLLLRHLATAEFSENRDRLFGSVEPINTNAVVGVGVFRDLEHISRSVVVKFHGQHIRREDVVGDVTAPLPGDAFVGRRVGDVCCQ